MFHMKIMPFEAKGVTADAEPCGSAPRGLRADPRGRTKKILINKKIEIAADPRGAESARNPRGSARMPVVRGYPSGIIMLTPLSVHMWNIYIFCEVSNVGS